MLVSYPCVEIQVSSVLLPCSMQDLFMMVKRGQLSHDLLKLLLGMLFTGGNWSWNVRLSALRSDLQAIFSPYSYNLFPKRTAVCSASNGQTLTLFSIHLSLLSSLLVLFLLRLSLSIPAEGAGLVAELIRNVNSWLMKLSRPAGGVWLGLCWLLLQQGIHLYQTE